MSNTSKSISTGKKGYGPRRSGVLIKNVQPARPRVRAIPVKGAVSIFKITGMPAGERIQFLRRGFEPAVVDELADRLHWSKEALVVSLDIPRSTVHRKKTSVAPLARNQSERLLKLADLVNLVTEMVERSGNPDSFDAGEWTGRWLQTPSAALGGQPPASLLDTDEGTQLVRNLLAQMESGAYA